MDDHVLNTLIDFCNFFDAMSRKSISVRHLTRLQEEIISILCELEIYFPSSFLDIMVHLLVHIIAEVKDLGPTFLHTMSPFEWMNGIVKGYVRNKARLDGSIVQAYLIEECISFCKNVINDDQSLGLPLKKHVDRLEGVGHSHPKRDLNVDLQNRRADFDRAHTIVLQHADIISPWQQTHKVTLRREHEMAGR